MNATTGKQLISALCVSSLLGCAAHTVRVNAYLSKELPFPALGGDVSPALAVVVGSDPDEPLLEAEVSRKVQYLVRERGFAVGEEASAPYILTCWVSIDDGIAETTTDYAYRRPGFATTYVYTGRGHWGGVGFRTPGACYEQPQTTIYYTRFLGLTLYARERWAGASEEELGEAAIWTCTAKSTGTSSDLRSWVNFLLAGAFEQFGLDTGKQLRLKFTSNDARVQAIFRAGRNGMTNQSPAIKPQPRPAKKEASRDSE